MYIDRGIYEKYNGDRKQIAIQIFFSLLSSFTRLDLQEKSSTKFVMRKYFKTMVAHKKSFSFLKITEYESFIK